MSRFHSSTWWLVAASAAVVAAVALSRAAGAQGSADADKGIDVLTRGSVHEAIAATVTFDLKEGIVAPWAPPVAVEVRPAISGLSAMNDALNVYHCRIGHEKA